MINILGFEIKQKNVDFPLDSFTLPLRSFRLQASISAFVN